MEGLGDVVKVSELQPEREPSTGPGPRQANLGAADLMFIDQGRTIA